MSGTSEPSLITAKNVDLSNCDREQIHIPGAIQPHGAMLVVDEERLNIVQASANSPEFFGSSATDLLGKPLSSAFGKDQEAELRKRLAHAYLDNGPVHLLRVPLEACDCNVFAHRSGGALIFEVERVREDTNHQSLDPYFRLRGAISRLQTTTGLQDFFDQAVSHIRSFTGFERVLVYKFQEDGSGHVIAESKLDELEPYLGLHYPASDIPAPARRLFALSWLRNLPDVNYQPVLVIPYNIPSTGEPLDMSQALLRSVSVMYSDYLKNMGVKATMVMPLMKNGSLWGLISAMHHSTPRHVPYEDRMAAEFLAHMLSLMMASREDADSYEYRLRIKTTLDGIMRALGEQSDLHSGLRGGQGQGGIKEYIDCGGAAIVTEDQISLFGETPAESDIRILGDWLSTSSELVTSTDYLSSHYPPAAEMVAAAAGLLTVRLSKRRREFVMWFRPEQAQTVCWAGNPNKPVELDISDSSLRLRPRTSFAIWNEEVAGRSRSWADYEIKAAADLRWAIVEVVLARAEETERLNRELRDVNLELDSFAYIASHDLKEPLRGINYMATFLERGHGERFDEQGRSQLATIVKLTRRMDDLIEALLNYSRAGRAELTVRECSLEAVLNEALMTLRARIEETGTIVRRPRPLPKVIGEPVRLRDVFTNLISNAIKYNDKLERCVVIGFTDDPSPAFYVRDNGIGIEEKDCERIFQIFRRLHARDEFGGGSGAGLTIARKTVERHGGRMWVESIPGEGSTFWFTLHGEELVNEPKPSEADRMR